MCHHFSICTNPIHMGAQVYSMGLALLMPLLPPSVKSMQWMVFKFVYAVKNCVFGELFVDIMQCGVFPPGEAVTLTVV